MQPEDTPPTMTPVQSSNIAEVGHDGHALWIRYKSGGLYRYPGAADHHTALLNTDSPGRYVADRIRHTFRGERIA